MRFAEFCRELGKIEATAKRLEMTALLAALIKKADKTEVDKVVMLALGRLAPLYKDIDFGLAEKMVGRAIGEAFGAKPSEVIKRYKQLGDLGETAAAIAKITKISEKREPSVSDVFDKLIGIAGETGEGSQERKIAKTADLLRNLEPVGAKYAVRIILGNLRLGFSDKTVLDALSVMIAGDKSAREKLEAAYNVRPDVGALARQIINHKSYIRNFKVEPELGVPILPALCQRLASAEEIVEKMREVAVEPKWDGQRIQAHLRLNPNVKLKMKNEKLADVKLFTRSLEDVTVMFPDLVAALETISNQQSAINNCILDGEVVGINPDTGRTLPFQTMITRKRKYGVQEKLADVPVKYMVFDILYLNGKSLMNEPFSERRRILDKLINRQIDKSTNGQLNNRLIYSSIHPLIHLSSYQAVQLAPQIVTSDPAEIRKFLNQQISSGLEGIVAKRMDAPYIPGRTQFAWVKLKWEGAAKSGGLLDTVDCVVMGTYAGKGKRAGFGVGAFLVGIAADSSSKVHKFISSKFVTISKIGTGLSDEQWRELKVKGQRLKVKGKPKEYDVPKELAPDVWLKPELVAEIQADNITKSPLHTAGHALRFPRLVKYRDDKRPDQATTTEEIENLYKMQ